MPNTENALFEQKIDFTDENTFTDNLKSQGQGILVYMKENNDSENKRIFTAAVENSDPKFDRIYIFLPLVLNEINFDLDERKEYAKKYVQNFAITLNDLKYSWTYIIAPTYDSLEKFKDVLKKYRMHKVILPESKSSFNNWLKKNLPKTKGFMVDELEDYYNPNEGSSLLGGF
eukprot:TRINITY_DN3064_c0_g1_i2.p1 TRINITY_DN3064_c0_g1~~TRINITY_DN3064_c0_g1_i2.p1  ORF type:complete len:173 (+),score=33.28 TRINITY_DN3064_c0_g1_i2:34-552(+)